MDCLAYIEWIKCISIGHRSIKSITNGTTILFTEIECCCCCCICRCYVDLYLLELNICSFGLELHIVSHDQRFKNFSTAVQNRKGIAVLGVLFHVSDDVNLVLKNILDTAERVREIVGETSFMTMPIAPAQLLPPDRLSYFRYEGSLTTPSCDEAVIWTIFDRSIPFAMTQIERFQQVKDPDGNLLTHNFRQLQRLNSRPLVYVRDDNAFYIHSAATIQTISLAMIISIILIQRVQVFGA